MKKFIVLTLIGYIGCSVAYTLRVIDCGHKDNQIQYLENRVLFLTNYKNAYFDIVAKIDTNALYIKEK